MNDTTKENAKYDYSYVHKRPLLSLFFFTYPFPL